MYLFIFVFIFSLVLVNREFHFGLFCLKLNSDFILQTGLSWAGRRGVKYTVDLTSLIFVWNIFSANGRNKPSVQNPVCYRNVQELGFTRLHVDLTTSICKRGESRIMAAQVRFMRTRLDCTTNLDITNGLNTQPVMEFIEYFRTYWKSQFPRTVCPRIKF
jgi:hypothetical protein